MLRPCYPKQQIYKQFFPQRTAKFVILNNACRFSKYGSGRIVETESNCSQSLLIFTMSIFCNENEEIVTSLPQPRFCHIRQSSVYLPGSSFLVLVSQSRFYFLFHIALAFLYLYLFFWFQLSQFLKTNSNILLVSRKPALMPQAFYCMVLHVASMILSQLKKSRN